MSSRSTAASKVVIVTGASRGIGLAAVQYLVSQGHRVLAVARSEKPLRDLEAQHPEHVKGLPGDLSDFALGKQAVDVVTSKWGQLDGLVINHGTLGPVKRISDTTAEEWRDCFDINAFSAIAMVKAAIPALRRTRGAIIFTSSGAATGAYSTWGAYGASKAVLNHMAMTLAVEEPDITTISIRPGTVDTEMQREIREVHQNSMDKKDVDKFASLKADGKLVKADQPGNVIAKLSVDAPKELSGQFLNWNDQKLLSFQ